MMADIFFTTNADLAAKHPKQQPEMRRMVRQEDVRPRALHEKFSPDPNAAKRPVRVIMSSDLRKIEDNRKRLAVAAERKALIERRRVAAAAAATGAEAPKPERKKPGRKPKEKAAK